MQNTYKSIAIDIMNKVQNGELKPGDKLSSEAVLLKEYNVSKMTLRKAINMLNNLEITTSIERQGTFIQKRTINQTSANSFTVGYSLLSTLKGLENTNETTSFKVVAADKNVASKLNISENQEVYEIKRIRYLAKLPSAYEVSYIVKEHLPTLTAKDLKSSLYDKVYEIHNLPIENVTAKIQAIIPDSNLVRMLKLQKDEGVFVIEQVSKVYDHCNFEYVMSYQAGSRINI